MDILNTTKTFFDWDQFPLIVYLALPFAFLVVCLHIIKKWTMCTWIVIRTSMVLPMVEYGPLLIPINVHCFHLNTFPSLPIGTIYEKPWLFKHVYNGNFNLNSYKLEQMQMSLEEICQNVIISFATICNNNKNHKFTLSSPCLWASFHPPNLLLIVSIK